MALKLRALGTMVAAARGIVMSALSTGTPLSITLTAGHRQRNGDRIAIVGLAADNGTFGEWSLSGIAATSGVLDGSTGSAALSGTPVIAAVMDRTPFLPNHSAVAFCGSIGTGTAPTAAIGTLVFEGADQMKSDGSAFQYNSASTGALTDGLRSVLLSGEIAIPAFTNAGSVMVEVKLARYMTVRASAWTSGNFFGAIMA